MVVYGELLFLENAMIGAVLLYLTGAICGSTGGNTQRHGRRRTAGTTWKAAGIRLAAGAVMCGAFSLVIFLDAKAPLMLLMEAAFAVMVCAVVFGRGRAAGCRENATCRGNAKRKGTGWRRPALLWGFLRRLPWQQALTFLLVTYFMGGITMGLLLVTDNTGIYTAAGIYTGDMKAGWLALFVGISFITVKQMIRTIKRKKFYSEHVFTTVISVAGRTVEAGAFLDTGNSLREPVSGRPVAVAGSELWQRMEATGLVTENRFCIVPYGTVGGGGVLTAVRTDHIEVDGKRIKGAVIAKGEGVVCPWKFEEYGQSQLLKPGIGLLLSKDMIVR